MLEEMGTPYQLVEKTTRSDDLQSDDICDKSECSYTDAVDGDLVLWESMAINLYLAQKFEGPMHCAGAESWVWLLNGASGPCWRRKRYCLNCCTIAQC